MASIRRTDIMHNKFSKGRPVKSERERLYKRQEAYKWRDARRVYLASSFDRWRKLRSSLKLKDYSLAWHLMEAHEKGHCTFCRQCNSQLGKQRRKCDPKDFLPSLIASIRQLCFTHFSFDECIEVVGLLCLEFDKTRKENFSLNECIRSGVKSDSVSCVSTCSQQLPKMQGQYSSLAEACCLDGHSPVSEQVLQLAPVSDSGMVNLPDAGDLAKTPSLGGMNVKSQTSGQQRVDDPSPPSESGKALEKVSACVGSPAPAVLKTSLNDITLDVTNNRTDQLLETNDLSHNTGQTLMDCSLSSESEPSLEIDIEKMDTSQEDEHCVEPSGAIKDHHLLNTSRKSDSCHENPLQTFSTVSNNRQPSVASEKQVLQNKIESVVPLTEVKISSINQSDDPTSDLKTDNTDLPLDMSVLKSCVKNVIDASITLPSIQDRNNEIASPNYRVNDSAHLEFVKFLSGAGKRKISETSSISPQGSRRSPFWLEGFQSSPGKMKEEGHASIPWQRRDMSRKEEYEFLEMNPFSDLADFSQRYPHVHQRTYYRWKRRIKEEYIILEQCPGMSFHEFSSVVLQAKESVFYHWKSLIAQGKGFFAPSDTSKRLETKCALKPSSHPNSHNSVYTFMQKNLTFTYDQFCQHFPGTPVDVFNVLKRKAMQEFWLFHQNQHMSYKDLSKIVNLSEDVFSTWKEYVESLKSNTVSSSPKTVSNSISPNPNMSLPFHSLDVSHSSPANLQFQPPKDDTFGMKDSSVISKEAKSAANAGVLNSSLSDSVARSLSTSYLASLQNMMFPWHSYYGMTSPLSQQMLPMMLWPSMMGLAGGIPNSLGLMSGLNAEAVRNHSNASILHNSLFTPASESTDSMKSDESQSNHSDELVNNCKSVGNNECREQTSCQVSSDSEKRMKMSNDKDEVEYLCSLSRSRKQNKYEYVYYLKNPELCFKELESLFPSISLRTFYRWRKEMNAAVLLLEDNKDMTFHQFQTVFPDIPEDVFESWKDRAGKGLSQTLERHTADTGDLNCTDQSITFNNQSCTEQLKPQGDSMVELTDNHISNNSVAGDNHLIGVDDGARLPKKNKEGYLYVQKNPNVDFASFSRLYPDVSVRSFYRWKKELKDALDFLRANPTIDYETYKAVDATISLEVFSVWKAIALDSPVIKEEISDDSAVAEEKERSIPNNCSRKLTGPEYWFLQLNPYIEFFQFTRTYPDVSQRTFYRWKQEIKQIMNYIRTEPSVEFTDITSVLPQVSEDAFVRWKQIIAAEMGNSSSTKNTVDSTDEEDASLHRFEIDECTKSQMTEALLYLMHNPKTKYNDFKVHFNFVSPATFELWLKRIITVILHIASNPSIDYIEFSSSFNDITEDVFEIWKKLSSHDIAALEAGQEEAVKNEVKAESRSILKNSDSFSESDELSLEAFEFCQKNPKLTFATFQITYPNVPEKLFCQWMSRIQTEMQCVRENPHIKYEDFAKLFPHTKQDIFYQWQSGCNGSLIQHFLQKLSDDTGQEDGVHMGNCARRELSEQAFNCRPNSIREQKVEAYEKSHSQDTVDDSVVNGKPDNELNESSLSKLVKFAGSSVPAYSKKHLTNKVSSYEHLMKDNNKTIKLESQYSQSDSDNFPNVLDAANTISGFHSKNREATGIESDGMYSAGQLTAIVHNSSLSALMAMSQSEDAVSRSNHSLSPTKECLGPSLPSVKSQSWEQASNGPGGLGGSIKDDDEAFSSQRQKKMSRAEYLFVKDNPDVDSQEFSRIFPGVSARTFYRWKKEIKAQLNIA